MSEENQVDETSAQFNAIVEKVKEKQTLTHEDAEFLVSVIAGFDINLRVAQEVMSVTLGTAQEMLTQTASAVLRKCGRTDRKIRRKVDDLCADNFEALLGIVKLYSRQVHEQLTNPKEDDNVQQDNSSNPVDSE